MSFTTYLANKLLDHAFRNTAYAQPATVYIALYTAAPSDAGGGTEVAGNGYARVAVAFSAASAKAIASSGIIAVGPCVTANWGLITHGGVFDALTGGNLMTWAAITNRTIEVGDSYQFAAADIDVLLT
ncbi:MAG: hypothetical protein M3R63_18495 [Actinomycetota bacterium]|nr:hypothetical protein [Actinomycetota bacterium]